MEKEAQLDVMPWYIVKADDGLQKDAILVGRMDGEELVSVSLHVAHAPAKEER